MATKEIIDKNFVRVSQILSPFQDFSKIHPEVLRNKCEIGTEVHEYIKAYYTQEFYPVSYKAQEYIPAFKSALTSALSNYTPLLLNGKPFLEKRLYSEKLRITGAMDALFSTKNNITLVDYKTSYTTNLPVWRLQMAMYSMLIVENEITHDPDVRILHLKKKGSFSFINVTPKEEDFYLAKSAIKLYHHFN